MKPSKVSPLRTRSLPVVGESLTRRLQDVERERLILAGGFAFVAALTWLSWFDVTSPPSRAGLIGRASMLTGVLVVLAVCTWLMSRRLREEARRLKLGRDGEVAVGQAFDDLRSLSCRVFHDVPTDHGNLDHVLISAAGVYAVETKTRTKQRGDRLVRIGDVLRFGSASDATAIPQAAAGARWLRRLLQETTTRDWHVRAVVVAPGWNIEGGGHRHEVWLLTESGLATTIRNARRELSEEDVALTAKAVETYLRARSPSEQGRTSRFEN